MAKGKLPPLQERFCREYLIDLNGTKAAERAGYTGSEAVLAAQASRLLRKANVAARVKSLRSKQDEKLEIKSDDILRELMRLGFSDIRALYDENGAIKSPKDWPEDLARAVAGVEVFEEFEFLHGGFTCEVCSRVTPKRVIGVTKKVKFWSKDRGLDLLGKHKGLFPNKVEHSGSITLEDLIAGSNGEEKE